MKKLAILGASYLQLPLVQKAKSNNIEVHCFAWDNELAVCKNYANYFYDISVLEKDKILTKCIEIGIDGITTIATDICIPVITYIANKLNLVGNSEYCSLITTNKGEMRKCFEINKIPSPKYNVVKSVNDIFGIRYGFPLIVKPTDRSGSLAVVKVENTEELSSAIENCISVSLEKSCIIEEYITGVEVSVETLSWQGEHQVVVITDKEVTAEPFFVELAHHQPSQLEPHILDNIKKLSLKILDATEVENGASHIELKIALNGDLSVIEIGSRMGGDFIGSDLVPLSIGFDYLQAVIDIALNQYDGKYEKTISKFSGVYFLSKNTENILPYFDVKEAKDFKIVKKEINNVDLKRLQNSNDRSGYLIYQAEKKINLI